MVSSEKSSKTETIAVGNNNPTLDALMSLLSSLDLSRSENETLVDMLTRNAKGQAASPPVPVTASATATPTTCPSNDANDANPSIPSVPDAPRASVIRVNSATVNSPPALREIVKGDEAYPIALAELAKWCTLCEINGTYYNMPLNRSPPFYFIIHGLHIGVFSGWDIAGPKVQKVSGVVYAGCGTMEAGEKKVRQAIERGEAWRIV